MPPALPVHQWIRLLEVIFVRWEAVYQAVHQAIYEAFYFIQAITVGYISGAATKCFQVTLSRSLPGVTLLQFSSTLWVEVCSAKRYTYQSQPRALTTT